MITDKYYFKKLFGLYLSYFLAILGFCTTCFFHPNLAKSLVNTQVPLSFVYIGPICGFISLIIAIVLYFIETKKTNDELAFTCEDGNQCNLALYSNSLNAVSLILIIIIVLNIAFTYFIN